MDRIPIATKGGKTAAGKDQIIHYTQQQRGKLFYTSTSNILNLPCLCLTWLLSPSLKDPPVLGLDSRRKSHKSMRSLCNRGMELSWAAKTTDF